MRRVTLLVLTGLLFAGLKLSLAMSDERPTIRTLPDRPEQRRPRENKNAGVFQLLPTWRKSQPDPRQNTKSDDSQVFRLLTLQRELPDETDNPVTETKKHFPSDDEAKLLRLLNKRISVDFQETPLADAVKWLSARCDVNLFIDPRGTEDAGATPATKITATAQAVRLCTVLDQILSPLDLDYIVVNEVIKITSRQQAKGEMITKTYPVSGLIPPLKDGRAAPDLAVVGPWIEQLRTKICPETWEESSGPGSIVFYRTTESIVVRQTSDVHEELTLHLESLRDEQSQATDGEQKK